jgi:7-carboxy-7-deazaguanine synthase
MNRLTDKDEIKFVIGCRGDYEYAKKILDISFLRTNPPLFSPVFGKMDAKILAGWILEDHLNVRLHMQLHKIIWKDEDRK